MSDKEQPLTDLELARLVRELDREIQPERNLWQGIERQIHDHPQRPANRGLGWMPYAVAASLVIAVSALVLNIVQLQKPDAVPRQVAGIETMESELVQVRNPLIAQFDRVNSSLDSKTKTEIYRNLEILANARENLEAEVRKNPTNTRLRELLIRVHEQELALLRQDFTRSAGRSL